jgi:hypothetical protein
MWRISLKRAFFTLCSVVVFTLSLCGLQALGVCKLRSIEGRRVFYLKESSSNALQTEKLDFFDIWKVRAESVRFNFQTTEMEKGRLLSCIIEQYGACILSKEIAGNTESYYGYSPLFGNGVVIGEEKVNLHIVFAQEQVVIGTPIIFGGF